MHNCDSKFNGSDLKFIQKLINNRLKGSICENEKGEWADPESNLFLITNNCNLLHLYGENS